MDDFVLTNGHQTGEGAHSVDVRVPEGLKTLGGHFPGDPIVPGVSQVLLVERAAREAWSDLGDPAAMVRLKFMETLRPGDELRLSLRREKEQDVRFSLRRAAAGDAPGVECSRGVLRFVPQAAD